MSRFRLIKGNKCLDWSTDKAVARQAAYYLSKNALLESVMGGEWLDQSALQLDEENEMGYQTLESLKERKIDGWLNRGVITKAQYKNICYHCGEYGFWQAMGYATKLKYQNHPSTVKYEYKWIYLTRDDCKLVVYKTNGSFSGKSTIRIRKWRNVFFASDDTDRNIEDIEKQHPTWKVFHMKHGCYRIGLRRPVSA